MIGLLVLASTIALISRPIPVPTVLMPLESATSAYKFGFSLVVPPDTNFLSFRYKEMLGPTLSGRTLEAEPPK